MQMKTSNSGLQKMNAQKKAKLIGTLGKIAEIGTTFIPGAGPLISGAIKQGTNMAVERVEEKGAQEVATAQGLVNDNNSTVNQNVNAINNDGSPPVVGGVVNPNDPTVPVTPAVAKKGTLKKLQPINSYYGEAKNMSALTYKNSILMKTISGVSTLKKDGVVSPAEEKYGKKIFGEDYNPNLADRF